MATLYTRDTTGGWAHDTQPRESLENPTNGWSSEYDEVRDEYWVTAPYGQGVRYYRVR